MGRTLARGVCAMAACLCLLGGCAPPVETEAFSPEDFQAFVTSMLTEGRTEDTYRFSGGGNVKSEVDSLVYDLTERDGGFIYLVEKVEWSYASHYRYGEVTVDLQYKSDVKPLQELSVAGSVLEAANLVAEQLEEGEWDTAFFVEGAEWELQSAYLVATAAQNNALTSCVFDSYTYSLMPEEGERRVMTITFNSSVSPGDRAVLQKELDETVAAIASEIRSSGFSEDAELYRAVHDAVVTRAEYSQEIADAVRDNYATPEMSVERSAYGALVSGQTVCTGYAYAYKALCDVLSLPSWVVEGTADGEGHSWNLVRVDGKDYFVDCTADDALGGDDYFLFTEADPQYQGYAEGENSIRPW